MFDRRCFWAIAACAVIAGCGSTMAGVNSSGSSNATDTAVQNSSTKTVDASTLKTGSIVFLRCRSCHTLEAEGVHLTGPNLNGLFGAAAGSKQGYAFSDALVDSGVVWDNASLDEWLKNPAEFVPGNRMVFAGLASADERFALIAYLEANTQ